ncbi:hypothetical protein SDRG_12889 [Saprolegnia diclina VS20]|uniref:EF-hand domain-containing protein n=1 Tax=Saprolegnia diclina (strain VS20) TaxID=1156394 RepID=T0Q4B8_SAPDV|nr:hypothetical protein SDRG_12889 [Saprolegnia diclina VS20]EQC29426.1 hypothetical protein SDRG_12889 [Saprolegnia diclina VS20]|eukprot:XP_008617193.1 hypothetical protein SDRG_12889 [Saprolegnia diclina VS20]
MAELASMELRGPEKAESPLRRRRKKGDGFPRAMLWSWTSDADKAEAPARKDDGDRRTSTASQRMPAIAPTSPPLPRRAANQRPLKAKVPRVSRRLSMYNVGGGGGKSGKAIANSTLAPLSNVILSPPKSSSCLDRIIPDDAVELVPVKSAIMSPLLDETLLDEPKIDPPTDADYLCDDVNDRFWRIYQDGARRVQRPDSSRGRYLRHCEDEALLPLPLLDLRLHKAPQPHYSADGGLSYVNYFLGDRRAEALGDALELLPVRISSIAMTHAGISGQGSAAIVTGVKKEDLLRLNFAHNHIGAKGYMKLNTVLDDTSLNLQVLDLSNNQLGDQSVTALVKALLKRCTLTSLVLSHNKVFHSAKLLGDLLRVKTALTHLDLSWNQIRGDPACHLATAMAENDTLLDLVLSDNSLGNSGGADIELATSLVLNSTLTNLNVSNNHIKGRAIFVFVDMCKSNASIAHLDASSNPIGTAAVEAILHAMATASMQCIWDLSNCNIEIQEYLYSPTYCTGPYKLDLADRSDHVVLKELLSMHAANRIAFSNVSLNGQPFALAKGTSVLPPHLATTKVERGQIPFSGILALHVTKDEEASPDLHLRDTEFCKIKDLIGHSFDLDDHKKMTMIKILADGFCVTVNQASTLLALFSSPTCQAEKASAAAALIPQISNSHHHSIDRDAYLGSPGPVNGVFFEDKDNDGKIDVCGDITVLVGLQGLDQIEQGYVEQKLGKWIAFNPTNPTGFYRLNMSNFVDRRIMLKLIEANVADRRFRAVNKLPDVSQHGNNNGFRNARYNHKPISLDASWSLPRLGVLEFDFVATRRPPAGAIPLSDAAFEQFFKEFKAIPDMKLVGLRAISNLYFFTARHAQRLMEYFSPYEKIDNALVRLEVFVILLNRIVDEANFSDALSILDAKARKKLLDRVGIVQVFNPLSPGGKYDLSLDEHDQRYVATLLLQLSRAQEGSLHDVTFNGADVENLHAVWLSDNDIPKEGVFKCKFMTANRCSSIVQLSESSLMRRLSQSIVFRPGEASLAE